jgi:predicted dithiol-disulfide oxidoreductase (DUF899 family)
MTHPIGTRREWEAARRSLLEREKELTRMGDALASERQALPWVPVEKEYVFDTEHGEKTLAELFGGRSQLIVYHFMFGPDWEEGCVSCSSIADHMDLPRVHLEHHDVAFVAVSRAPLEKLLAYRSRMGWSFNWASSYESDFNFDFDHSRPRADVEEWAKSAPRVVSQFASDCGTDAAGYVSEGPGLSVFARSGDQVYLTYSNSARGLEPVMVYYGILDMVPSGREGEPPDPAWMRRHDEFE